MRSLWAIAKVSINELVRKKDFYVLFILMSVVLGFLSMQDFFGIEGISRYVRDFGYTLVMFFSFIIAATFTARQLPEEIETKTVYPLLAKPVSRFTVVGGKFWGGFTVLAAAFTLYYIVFAGFYLSGGDTVMPVLLLQGFAFGIFFLCLVCAMVVFFSNFMTVSANVTVSILIYFMVNGFADKLREAVLHAEVPLAGALSVLYYIIPHFDFFDMRVRLTHSWDPVAAWVVGAVLLYTVLYSVFLLYLSGKVFEGKEL